MKKTVTSGVIADKIKMLGNPEKSKTLSKFFKTGYGEYAHGDKFLGISVPDLKVVSKRYFKEINLSQTARLINSVYHEIRRAGLEILVLKMDKEKNEIKRKNIFSCYINNVGGVNNWDLVDASSPQIVGEFLKDKSKILIYDFAASDNIWKQRISIVSTFCFVRMGNYSDTFAISEMLMDSREDLIHKAIGWMLREVGKRDIEAEINFLDRYANVMPRTALRYSIEKFDDNLRKYYMEY